jgi:hypothetical protein
MIKVGEKSKDNPKVEAPSKLNSFTVKLFIHYFFAMKLFIGSIPAVTADMLPTKRYERFETNNVNSVFTKNIQRNSFTQYLYSIA